MRRLLKPTDSVYLHSDPTACNYLKLVMDAVFGTVIFRSQMTWRGVNAKGLAFKGYPHNVDYLLYNSNFPEY